MQIIRHITAIVMVLALHQSVVARAEAGEPTSPSAPPSQTWLPPSQEQPSEGVPKWPPEKQIYSSPTNTSANPRAEDQESGFVDMLHREISRRLLTTAVWLDSFFADERSIKEENRSYIRARYDVFKEKDSSATFKPTVDLRLALPQLEKKAHIVVSAEPAETPATTPITPNTTTERIGTTEERNVTTAVHYVLRATEEQNFTVRSGAQFTHGSPELFIAPRYRYFVPLSTWGFRFTQEEIWKTDTRWQVNTVFDLERQLPHDLFFRTSVGGTWIETEKGYFYGISFSLRQPLDSKRALDYEWNNSFQTRSVEETSSEVASNVTGSVNNSYQTRPIGELTEVFFRVRYRQNFWREYLFFEVAPQYRFPRDRNYHGTPGILFRIEMFFGKQA